MPRFEIKKDPTKVFILGTGGGCEYAPKESERLYYCLNDYIKVEKYGIKPDVLFIMDTLDEKPQIVSGSDNLGDIVARINSLRVPFIAPYKYEEIPLSQAFPLNECARQFGAPYFKNTIGYMIAYALLQKVKEMDIYGVNQASSGEYYYEKGSVEYWLGIAIGRGVKIKIWGENSELLTDKRRFGGNILYGYNMTYEELKASTEKYGEGVIKKLSVKIPNTNRIVRSIN